MWTLAEKALVERRRRDARRDAGATTASMLERGRSSRRGAGGLAPNYAQGDARAIIAKQHEFASWDEFAAFAGAR